MDNEIQDKYMDAVLAMLMDEYAEVEYIPTKTLTQDPVMPI